MKERRTGNQRNIRGNFTQRNVQIRVKLSRALPDEFARSSKGLRILSTKATEMASRVITHNL